MLRVNASVPDLELRRHGLFEHRFLLIDLFFYLVFGWLTLKIV